MKPATLRQLYLVCSMMMIIPMQASENCIQQADIIVQTSYQTIQASQLVQKFIHQHGFYHKNPSQAMPSVCEILFVISQLQDSYGFIADQTLRNQVLDVLRATITATNQAIIVLQNSHNQDVPLHTATIDAIVYYNKLLRIQFSRVKHRSLQSYIMQPSTWYTMAGFFAIVSLGSLAYYYNLVSEQNEAVIPMTQEEMFKVQHNPGHQKALQILAEIAIKNQQINPKDYLPAAHEIIPLLDAKLDKNLQFLIQTFIDVQEGGIFQKIEAKVHEKQLKQTYASMLNSDPAIRAQAPDGIMWHTENINVMRLVK